MRCDEAHKARWVVPYNKICLDVDDHMCVWHFNWINEAQRLLYIVLWNLSRDSVVKWHSNEHTINITDWKAAAAFFLKWINCLMLLPSLWNICVSFMVHIALYTDFASHFVLHSFIHSASFHFISFKYCTNVSHIERLNSFS